MLSVADPDFRPLSGSTGLLLGQAPSDNLSHVLLISAALFLLPSQGHADGHHSSPSHAREYVPTT